jgi:hypothetical protein
LRDAFPLDLSGLCHATRIEDPQSRLKKLPREKYLLKKAKKTAAGAKLHPPAAGWNQVLALWAN